METESVKYSFKWSENEPLSTVTDRKRAHPHLCVRVGKGLFWSVIKELQYALPRPWSMHQECLMALEIRAACLFACLCKTTLHQMKELFGFIITVCICSTYIRTTLRFSFPLRYYQQGLQSFHFSSQTITDSQWRDWGKVEGLCV